MSYSLEILENEREKLQKRVDKCFEIKKTYSDMAYKSHKEYDQLFVKLLDLNEQIDKLKTLH